MKVRLWFSNDVPTSLRKALIDVLREAGYVQVGNVFAWIYAEDTLVLERTEEVTAR